MTDMVRRGPVRPGPSGASTVRRRPARPGTPGTAQPGMTRHCPDCGRDQPFEQLHPLPGPCPDSADGYCPEWSCTTCGAALLIGFIPFLCETARFTEARGRVA